jgi:hypothetical protein
LQRMELLKLRLQKFEDFDQKTSTDTSSFEYSI